MSQRIILSALLILWLASGASADGGDDFANNLASDLGPIIALFGERVVMQFMSQAMGIADCILLAVAPIGAITTVVSAIRVAGPTWLKSFIGRARENLAAAEVEVMSSTSKETCELWNGHRVVRCPGSANMFQFICLFPKSIEDKDIPSKLAQNGFTIRYKTLKDIKADIETATKETSKLLQQKEKTGPKYIAQFFKGKAKSLLDKLKRSKVKLGRRLTRLRMTDEEKRLDLVTSTQREKPQEESREEPQEEPITYIMPSLPSNRSSKDYQHRKESEVIIITDDLDDGAPNLLLNCHDRVGRNEIYLAAAFGIILQLGAILYFGIITYHKPIKHHFLKDGNNIVRYAFPCAAIGTMLLVIGLFICSWVVGESTIETFYEAENHKMFVVWLQKDHTVSDQEFRPYAIYPVSKRDYFTISRRHFGRQDHSERTGGFCRKNLNQLSDHPIVQLSQTILYENFKGLSAESVSQNEPKAGIMSSGTSPAQSSDRFDEQPFNWSLNYVTVVGSLISLIGFISQFIGMRGLNWTASIVQLGITIVVTILRVIVRRGLGKTPNRTVLKSQFELDWFVLSFGNIAAAHWIKSDKQSAKEIDHSGDNSSSTWEICTGGEQAYHPLKNKLTDNKNSLPHQIMLARKYLGSSSKWTSPVLEEANSLSDAIEAVANSFLSDVSAKNYEWAIPAIYKQDVCMKPVEDSIYVNIKRDDNRGWQVDKAEIEAILSLWVYSTSSNDSSKSSRLRNLRAYGPCESQKRLNRDLKWWMREDIPKILQRPEEDVTNPADNESDYTIVGFRTKDCGAKNPTTTPTHSDSVESFLVLECQDKPQRLFSRDLLFSFLRSVAKTPEVDIASASSAQSLSPSSTIGGWKQLQLKNNTISNLVRRFEKIGFGSLSDIYIDLIIPLSLEYKLTNVKNIIDDVTRETYEDYHTLQWEKLVDSCICLLDLALRFDIKKESSSPRAIATCLGFLYRLHHEAKLQESERRPKEELTIQLKRLKRRFLRDNFRISAYFSAILPNELKFFAISLNMLAGPDNKSPTLFPDSFQIPSESLKVIEESNSEQELHILFQDLEALKKTDAFGWSLLHYAAALTVDSINIDKCQSIDDFSNLRDLMDWTILHHACFFGNKEMVKSLLKFKAPIEIAGKDGITPMHCAVQSGKADIIQELIRHKEHTIKSKRHLDHNERHPIHWAAVEGNVEMVRLMKDSIALTDRFGWTPLHLAAIHEHDDLLQYLFEDFTDTINIRDKELRTPLHLAVRNESKDVVQILIQAGAKINTIAKDGSAPLHDAVRQKQKQILEMLLKGGTKKDVVDVEGRTPLYLSVEDGEFEIIEILIQRGASVILAADDGRTPLHVALSQRQGGLEVAKILLQAGADVNTKAEDGATVLHIAAQSGSLFETLNLLPDESLKSPIIDAIDEYGQTPLLIAIYEKEWEAAKLLLEKGAGVNAGKRSGYTPVLGAVIEEKEDILRQLLEKGANVNDADGDGYSALHLSIANRNQRIFQALLNANANINTVISGRNDTPLHIAVRTRQPEIVQILLDKGASTTVLNFRGFSPLQQALVRGDFEMVQIFLDHDKNSTIKAALQKNEDDETPLHTLAANTWDEDTACKMLEELLSIGPEIEINAKTRGGYTPLDLALLEGIRHRRFITKLLESGAKPGSKFTESSLEQWKKEYIN